MDFIKIPSHVLYSGVPEDIMLEYFKYSPSYYMKEYNNEWYVSKAESRFFFILVKGDFSNKRTQDTFERYIRNKDVLPLREAYEKYKPLEFSRHPMRIKDCIIGPVPSPENKPITFKSW